jgi:mRNA interferase HigB
MLWAMNVIAKRTLRAFWDRHPAARGPIQAWHQVAKKAAWRGPAEVKQLFGATIDILPGNRIVFDLGGNRYRLIAKMNYPLRIVFVRFIGSHAEYDRIDAETI